MSDVRYRNLTDRGEAIAALREQLAGAEEIVAMSAPAALVDELADDLEAVLDRGVLVLLLVGGEALEPARDRTYPATLVRHWEPAADYVTSIVVDYHSGMLTEAELHDPDGREGRALLYHDRFIGDLQLNTLTIAWWQRSPEIYATDPTPLPAPHDSYLYAVIDAAKYLRDGHSLAARIEGVATADGEPMTVEGQVVNVRQNIVSPSTNAFPLEQSIFVADDSGDVVSVGGPSAQVEDIRARHVELYEP